MLAIEHGMIDDLNFKPEGFVVSENTLYRPRLLAINNDIYFPDEWAKFQQRRCAITYLVPARKSGWRDRRGVVIVLQVRRSAFRVSGVVAVDPSNNCINVHSNPQLSLTSVFATGTTGSHLPSSACHLWI